jgi:hypothetical protein
VDREAELPISLLSCKADVTTAGSSPFPTFFDSQWQFPDASLITGLSYVSVLFDNARGNGASYLDLYTTIYGAADYDSSSWWSYFDFKTDLVLEAIFDRAVVQQDSYISLFDKSAATMEKATALDRAFGSEQSHLYILEADQLLFGSDDVNIGQMDQRAYKLADNGRQSRCVSTAADALNIQGALAEILPGNIEYMTGVQTRVTVELLKDESTDSSLQYLLSLTHILPYGIIFLVQIKFLHATTDTRWPSFC